MYLLSSSHEIHELIRLILTVGLAYLLLPFGINAQITPRILRIKEDVAIGTVVIPDIMSFLYGRSYVSPESFETDQTKKSEKLLAIGNAIMPGANWFAIDISKGSLIVKSKLDRDLLCPTEQKLPDTAVSIARGGIEFPEYNINSGSKFNTPINQEDCLIKLSIIHGTSSNPSFDIITIVLEDVNNHAPIFDNLSNIDPKTNEYIITISETTKKNEFKTNSMNKHLIEQKPLRILLPTAKDLDYGIHSIKGYRLEGEDAFLFRLEIGSSFDDDIHPNDNNINNNRMIKSNLQNNNRISSNNNNNQLTFAPTNNIYQTDKQNKLWLIPVGSGTSGIDPLSNGQLDREYCSEYHIILVAYDGGSPPNIGKLPIKIVVEDINDHAPEFNQEFYVGKISENDAGGHVVFEFSAQDKDSTKQNGLIKFHIPGQYEFKVNQHSLYNNDNNNNNNPNNNNQNENEINLPENQIIAANLFAIEYNLDKNNDPNHFVENHHNNTVYARLIIKRQAKEKIQQLTSRAISLAYKNQISIKNKNSKQYHFNSNDMHQSYSQLQFFIEAYDTGQPKSLSTQVSVYIQIIDVNDYPPQIFISYLKPINSILLTNLHNTDKQKQQLGGKLTENLDRSMIAQVIVTDSDTIQSNTHIICKTNDSRFSLEEIISTNDKNFNIENIFSSNNQNNFLNKQTKFNYFDSLSTKIYKLMSISPLDRESNEFKQQEWIKFSIICIDNQNNELPGGSLTSQADVLIEIEDSNDNAPIFDHTQYRFHVPENHPQIKTDQNQISLNNERYPVGLVHATDKDYGLHSAIEYQINSNPSGSVQVDKHNGMIYIVQPFDRETVTEIVFQILAIDCYINSNNNNNNTKSLTPITPFSSISATTSSSSVSSSSCHNHRLTGTTEVHLIIDDLNDSPPIFQETNYHFEVEEGLDLVKVGQVWATDADQNEAARIAYRLAVTTNNNNNHNSNKHNNQITETVLFNEQNTNAQFLYDEALEITTHFQIDPRSGLIHLKGRLDREKRAHYEFVVLAIDNPRAMPTKISGNQRLGKHEVVQFTATATVLITVLDHNDNPPRIISPLNHVEFMLSPEQLIAGNTIFTIRATDPDLGENGTIEYKLIRVEDDLGMWTNNDAILKDNQYLHDNSSAVTELQATIRKDSSEHIDLADKYPFAVDRTAGICYLRENLPSFNSETPRAFMLRILAYDLGRPISLNTTLIVRITQHLYSPNDNEMEGINSNHIISNDFRHSNKLLTHALSGSNIDGDAKIGTWTSAGQARISDRTMVVILSTVFILLLLTTIVLLLLIRYRRLLLRNIPIDRHGNSDGPASKANEGFTAGKPMSPNQTFNGYNGYFAEVVTAPWVNSSSSSSGCATNFNYPTIYNTGVGRKLTSSKACIANPIACWSPSATLCKSPTSHQVIQNDSQQTLLRSPPTLNSCSPARSFRMLPEFALDMRTLESGQTGVGASFTEMPDSFILQNYALQGDDEDGDRMYRDLTLNNHTIERNIPKSRRQSGPENHNQVNNMIFDHGFQRSWENDYRIQKFTPETEKNQNISTIRRTAISLEELTDIRDEYNNSRDYSRLVRFNLSPGNPLTVHNTNWMTNLNSNEYQALSPFQNDQYLQNKYITATNHNNNNNNNGNNNNNSNNIITNQNNFFKFNKNESNPKYLNDDQSCMKHSTFSSTKHIKSYPNCNFPDLFQLQPLVSNTIPINTNNNGDSNDISSENHNQTLSKYFNKSNKNIEQFNRRKISQIQKPSILRNSTPDHNTNLGQDLLNLNTTNNSKFVSFKKTNNFINRSINNNNNKSPIISEDLKKKINQSNQNLSVISPKPGKRSIIPNDFSIQGSCLQINNNHNGVITETINNSNNNPNNSNINNNNDSNTVNSKSVHVEGSFV